jgi:hypothetical protein
VFHVRYELDFCTPEDKVLHSHRREDLISYIDGSVSNRTVYFKIS